MNQRYTFLSAEQKLALTSEDLTTAINLEAAERGVAIPLNLADHIQQQGYVGHHVPADAVGFYQIMTPCKYGSGVEPSGVCFKTEDEALNAIRGALCIIEDGYAPTKKNVVSQGELTIQKTFLTIGKAQSFHAGIEEYMENREDYDKLCEELRSDLQAIRQSKYNAEVIAAKKAKYLELAEGNEATARRFWSNIERTDWPE